MTSEEAARIIKAILAGDKLLVRSEHFWERSTPRLFNVQDVNRILRRHVLDGAPRWDEMHGNWEVRLDGTTLDGRPTRVVLGLREVAHVL